MLKQIWKIPFWRHRLKLHNSNVAIEPHELDSKTTIIIEENATLKDVEIDKANLSIGAYSYIRSGAYLTGDIKIGRFCCIAKNVTIGLNRAEHPLDWLSTHLINKKNEAAYAATLHPCPTKIGNDCWIGYGATILSGVTIGDGAVIGANALIAKDVPAYSIVAGNPGKILRARFSEDLIQKLSALRWWELDHSIIQDLPLNNPLECIERLERIHRIDAIAMYKRLLISAAGVEPVKPAN